MRVKKFWPRQIKKYSFLFDHHAEVGCYLSFRVGLLYEVPKMFVTMMAARLWEPLRTGQDFL